MEIFFAGDAVYVDFVESMVQLSEGETPLSDRGVYIGTLKSLKDAKFDEYRYLGEDSHCVVEVKGVEIVFPLSCVRLI